MIVSETRPSKRRHMHPTLGNSIGDIRCFFVDFVPNGGWPGTDFVFDRWGSEMLGQVFMKASTW